jgi:hypothetical protein
MIVIIRRPQQLREIRHQQHSIIPDRGKSWTAHTRSCPAAVPRARLLAANVKPTINLTMHRIACADHIQHQRENPGMGRETWNSTAAVLSGELKRLRLNLVASNAHLKGDRRLQARGTESWIAMAARKSDPKEVRDGRHTQWHPEHCPFVRTECRGIYAY